jgi:hypothetical protein
MSDESMQVNFLDQTGVVLSADRLTVTFTEANNNQATTMWLSDVGASPNARHIIQRLAYIRVRKKRRMKKEKR